jgi:hypothetical protein
MWLGQLSDISHGTLCCNVLYWLMLYWLMEYATKLSMHVENSSIWLQLWWLIFIVFIMVYSQMFSKRQTIHLARVVAY